MATKPSKTKQTPVHVAIVAAHAAILPVLTQQAADVAESKAKTGTRSATIVAAIGALFTAFPVAADYQAACVKVFGNGAKKKAEKIAGSLAEALDAAKVTDLCVRTTLSHARTVARDFGKDEVAKAAKESGLRAGYDAAKPKALPEADAPAPATKPADFSVLLAAELNARGLAAILGMCESWCTVKADPIRAGMIREVCNKVKVA